MDPLRELGRGLLILGGIVVVIGAFLYFDGWNIQCARLGSWKLHVARNNTPAWAPAPVGGVLNLPLAAPELFCEGWCPSVVKLLPL